MAILVVEMEKIFKVDPDMYIMNAFIIICWPGLVAIAMALAFRLAMSAFEFCALEAFALAPFCSAATRLE